MTNVNFSCKYIGAKSFVDLNVINVMFLWSLSLRDVSLSTQGDNTDKALWYNLSILAKFEFEAEHQISLQYSIYGVIKVLNKSFLVSAVR